MYLRLWFTTFVALLICQAVLAQATIEGRVALPKARIAPVVAQRYEIVSKGGALAPEPPVAIVYLEGNFPKGDSRPVRAIAQKNMRFIPSLLAVQSGTRVEFPNQDDMYHNIFSYSPTKRFDLGRYGPDERPIPSILFDKPGLVTLRCDIHEHMRALILVIDTPYFSTTGPDGRFHLTNLPAGKFQLKAWIDSRTTRDQPVELKSGTILHINLP